MLPFSNQENWKVLFMRLFNLSVSSIFVLGRRESYSPYSLYVNNGNVNSDQTFDFNDGNPNPYEPHLYDSSVGRSYY